MAKLNLREDVASRTGTMDASAISFKMIPIGDIVVREDGNIRNVDASDISGLKASIRSEGLKQPVIVYRDGDEYVLKIGFRRRRAFKELHDKEPDRFHSIPSLITPRGKLVVDQLIENVQRENLKPIEMLRALKDLKTEGMSYAEISMATGMAQGTIKNYFSAIKDIEAHPENLDIMRKYENITLADIHAVKPVKDKNVKRQLLHAKGLKKIGTKELQSRARHASNNTKSGARKTAFLNHNEERFSFTIKFKEEATYRKMLGKFKSLLKENNIAVN